MVDYKSKTYTGYLLINWRDDDLNFRKTKPKKTDQSPYETVMKIDATVNVPKIDMPTLTAEVNVPVAQVETAAYGDIIADTDDDSPPWADDVEELIATSDAVDDYVHDRRDGDAVIDQLVGQALRTVDGFPDPADVADYVEQLLIERRMDYEAS